MRLKRPFWPRRHLITRYEIRSIVGDASRNVGNGATTTSATTTSATTSGAGTDTTWTPDRAHPVTIIVPVHNAVDDVRRCLESVFEHTMHPNVELLVIDDASTDPRILPLLETLGSDHVGVEVIRNATNLGFLGTMNRGFEHAVGRDVVMLNSDTIVTPRWLIGLCRVASDPSVGTVTPLSNNAWAWSAPSVGFNPLPADVDQTGRAVRHRSDRRYPAAPTGHGFCMLVKRQVLDAVGGFDEIFGRGYHEENDLSMRASAAGWRHLVDDATLIAHTGSVSFAGEKRDLLIANRALLDRRYPEYTDLIEAFVVSQQMALVRDRVADTFERVRRSPALPRVLFALDSANETPPRVADLMRSMANEYEPLVLRTTGGTLSLTESASGTEIARVEVSRDGSTMNRGDPDFHVAVGEIVANHAIEVIHVGEMHSDAADLIQIARQQHVPVIVTLDDAGNQARTVDSADSLRRADAFVTESEAAADTIADDLGLDAHRLHVLALASEVDRDSAEGARRYVRLCDEVRAQRRSFPRR